ncbi:unnamed protein product [Fusarium graminearum]|uniref:Uncharacterized protein n=2 Tax=Gibberella zeae TaxID=5518 RepID=I1S5E3_GIBZE|nr:hypothetical protein FGSG_12061 [Fusarium graminearum PH-1]PCD39032.1 hypothetical protein FGRA07_00303 [Fusarium graminearum]ESU07404.1 hypothetical protein FGSG_12061 [Fusarium graminearum PH-1]CAF3450687.1 unnamed protein product [Fusarium graminearum]CAF3609734.1 unnamed protein product [Fusarium graminearum]CAG1979261.1 unnamed protein product [Fusarium graminearum]|eukprot:XP_011317889.1 hypothetical protein FGSG_12061 [Fusarium graminearum PH-1]
MWEEEWAAAPEGTWAPDEIFLPRDEAFWRAPEKREREEDDDEKPKKKKKKTIRGFFGVPAAVDTAATSEERVAAVVAACTSRFAALTPEYRARIVAQDKKLGL